MCVIPPELARELGRSRRTYRPTHRKPKVLVASLRRALAKSRGPEPVVLDDHATYHTPGPDAQTL
jgi:hypothetical protein